MPPVTLRTLLVLALPMMAARATQAVDGFADALQTKHLGPEVLAAVATGGLNVFGFSILAIGTVYIVQSFVAQHVGRGERDLTPRYAWYGLGIALVAQILTLGLLPFIRPALDLAGYAPAVAEPMSEYMWIRMLSIFAIVGVEVIGTWYGGLGNTWMQLIAGLVATVANIVSNWIFIDGNLGAPALGVAGAALSSVIANWLALGVLAFAFWRRWGMAVGGPAPARDRPLNLSLKDLWRVLKFGVPSGLNWFAEFAAFQLFVNVVFAGLGAQALAGFNVVLAINSVAFMPAWGLGSAGAILAGQAIGAGNKDAVWPIIRLTLGCALTWMGTLAVIYAVAPEMLITLFASDKTTPEFIALGASMLLLSAAWQLFDATGITLSESLRAAGDTAWTATVRLVLAWLVFTPAALIAVKVFHAGAVGALVCMAGYLAILAGLFAYRFRSNKWRQIELIEPALV